MRNVVQADDAVGDTLRLDETHPADLRRVVAVGAAAGLGIHTLDVDHSEGVARDDTSLVEVESEFLLCFCLVHEILVNGVAVIDDSVSLIFNGSLFLLGYALEVSYVQVSTFYGFLGAILPHVRSEYLAARGEHNVRAGMVCAELLAAFGVYADVYGPALERLPFGELAVQDVQDDFPDFHRVDDGEGLI